MAATAEQPVHIPASRTTLDGILDVPANAKGIVVFAHGSGSSRLSPRSQYVAGVLRDAGFGTLLFDLLTPHEGNVDATTAHLRFDIRFLAERLLAGATWVAEVPSARGLPLGFFGASTGAAAALVAAAAYPDAVRAVVSRGGRPDLAGTVLGRVRTPTLLIVGGLDLAVIETNRRAAEVLAAEKDLVVVPGATHLFEEPGALERVADLAKDWFMRWLPTGAEARPPTT